MKRRQYKHDDERGMALITSLLATTLVLALGMAIVFSVTTDTTTTRSQRVGEQAFFSADAGIGVARRALAQAFSEAIEDVRAGRVPLYSSPVSAGFGEFPNLQVIPAPDGTWNSPFYQSVRDRAVALATAAARREKFEQINGSSFSVVVHPFTGSVTLAKTSATTAVEADVLRYWVEVTGTTAAGGSAKVNETGRISININLTAPGPDETRNFSFSGFGAFFDNGDTLANSALASGTFTGPVHTNTHFAFASNRSVSFRNVVTQADSRIRYDSWGSTTPNRAIPTADLAGIDISPEGYKQINAVPLPRNNFSQEYAVINATGITDSNPDGSPVDPPAAVPRNGLGDLLPVFDASGRVTVEALALNLRDVSGAAPNVSGGALASGVYISSADGSNVTGAGIYVQGDASDIQLVADMNGDQVYIIKQSLGGSTVTTTIRTSFANNKTTISSGSNSKTLSGVFTDKGDWMNPRPGAMLFVNGSINSLRGGKDSLNNGPAIASQGRLTVTAQRSITVTGDLKYANPVTNSDGTPVSNINTVNNVLGIFTNDGNVNLAPKSSFVNGPGLTLEMNAAVASFNANTSNDGTRIEGSITYTGGTSTGANDRWRLIGSRVQSKINNIGYNYRDIYFDIRFSGGKFAPPFFPGTTYELSPIPAEAEVAISSVDSPSATAMSWFRNNN
ncbi:MAG TPA: PilX N-terminal domain-containing pilus assembly protein [Blastocatellia bacterium]|nr:PilX N-terminal domain-containing pilus assembly protein [Blastocatellia bacterium]